MEAVDVLAGVESAPDFREDDAFRKRNLNEHGVDLGVGAQFLERPIQSLRGPVGFDSDVPRLDADVGARLVFQFHEPLVAGVVAHQDRRESGDDAPVLEAANSLAHGLEDGCRDGVPTE